MLQDWGKNLQGVILIFGKFKDYIDSVRLIHSWHTDRNV